jgi:hypothetical protein
MRPGGVAWEEEQGNHLQGQQQQNADPSDSWYRILSMDYEAAKRGAQHEANLGSMGIRFHAQTHHHFR